MNITTRTIITILISIITLVSALNRCQRREAQEKYRMSMSQGWTPDLEKQMYDVFYTQSAKLSTNEKLKKEYAACCFMKMKELYPKGVSSIGANMSDSARLAVMQMGMECASIFSNTQNVWTTEVAQEIKDKLYAMPETKMISIEYKEEYVNCVYERVSQKFPNGIEGKEKEYKDVIEKSRTNCLILMKNKYDSKLMQQK